MKPINEITTTDIIEYLKTVDKKTWVKVGIGAVIFSVVFVLLIWPAWFKRPQILTTISAVESQLTTTQALFRKKPELFRAKEATIQYLSEAKERLYAPGESSLLLGKISKLAEESNVTVVSSKPRELEQKIPAPYDQFYEGSEYDFTVEGGYHDIGRFIAKIESNPKLLRVRDFNVVPREDFEEVHLLKLTLTAISYKESGGAQ